MLLAVSCGVGLQLSGDVFHRERVDKYGFSGESHPGRLAGRGLFFGGSVFCPRIARNKLKASHMQIVTRHRLKVDNPETAASK